MAIVLRDVTKDKWQACTRLQLAPEQAQFVASNAYSLAESKFMPTFIPQAIYQRDDDADQPGLFRHAVGCTQRVPVGRMRA